MWGLDLSQSMQGAGGIGGLLAKVENGGTHYYQYDANGNVVQLVNASTGAAEARYEYDPYGNNIFSYGYNEQYFNPFRFSTKYLDSESNLYYYGYRYYDPETGRWTNRDPMGEDGGLNLYVVVLNQPVNYVDTDGRFLFPIIAGPIDDYLGGHNNVSNKPTIKSTESEIKAALAFDVSLAFYSGASIDNALRIAYVTADAKAKAGINKLVSQGVLSTEEGAAYYSRLRNEILLQTRDRSTPVGKYIAEMIKPRATLPSYQDLLKRGKTADSILQDAKANVRVTGNVANVARVARACSFVTLSLAVYEVATVEPSQRPRMIIKHVGGFTGAVGGAWSLGEIGGIGGTAVGGPPGGAIGSIGGALIGGVGGAIIGEAVAVQTFDAIVDK